MWSAPLDVDADTLAELRASLSPAERARAVALREDLLRRRYLADHGWRRRLLAERLGCAPAEVAYAIGAQGKPALAGGRPQFSASRAGAVALYALSESAAVGADVEEIREELDVAGFARRFFSASERAAIDRVAPERRAAAATACWTGKEAYAKALGTGLEFPLTQATVWSGDGRPVRHGGVAVHAVAVGPGLAAAVAVRAGEGDLVDVPVSPTALVPG